MAWIARLSAAPAKTSIGVKIQIDVDYFDSADTGRTSALHHAQIEFPPDQSNADIQEAVKQAGIAGRKTYLRQQALAQNFPQGFEFPSIP